MLLLWCMLVLSARYCSGSNVIPLDRATQSEIFANGNASNAIDGNPATFAAASQDSSNSTWLRIYFTNSTDVEEVDIEKGYSYAAECNATISVSVFEGEVKTLCGTYTKPENQYYYNETVQCGDKRGDSLKIEITGCDYLKFAFFSIKVYGQPTPKDCDKPSISDGSVSPDTDSIVSGAAYNATCSSGYTMDGSATITCYEGTLSTAPTCVEDCDKPSISDGSVSPDTDSIVSGAYYTATCSSGYTMDGSATITCYEGTLSTAPTCVDQCPKGYYELDRTSCAGCLRGSYSDKLGSTQCENCPSGQTNLASHSTNSTCYLYSRVSCEIEVTSEGKQNEVCTLTASCHGRADLCTDYQYCNADGVCNVGYSSATQTVYSVLVLVGLAAVYLL